MAYRRMRKRRRKTYRRKRRTSGGRMRRTGRRMVRGYGSYRIRGKGAMGPLVIKNTRRDDIIFRHREYLGELVIPATTDFTVIKSFEMNPGVIGPWLRGVVENFKEYEWRGAIFEIVPLSAMVSNSGAGGIGSVMIGTHYDVYEKPFEDKEEMLNSEFTTSAKPQIKQIHPIECKRSKTPVSKKWIRTEGLPAGSDQRLYDHCRTEIATQGIPGVAGTTFAEIWLTFEVAVSKPKMVDKRKFNVEQDVETFGESQIDNAANGTGVRRFFYGLKGFAAKMPHVPGDSSLNGAFYPGGISVTDPGPYYRWNGHQVQKGDIFRLLMYVQCSGAETCTMNAIAHVFHGCQAYNWYNGARNILNGGAAADASNTRTYEIFVQITEQFPGEDDKNINEPAYLDGPFFEWGSTLTFSAANTPTYSLLVHKIVNKPL